MCWSIDALRVTSSHLLIRKSVNVGLIHLDLFDTRRSRPFVRTDSRTENKDVEKCTQTRKIKIKRQQRVENSHLTTPSYAWQLGTVAEALAPHVTDTQQGLRRRTQPLPGPGRADDAVCRALIQSTR